MGETLLSDRGTELSQKMIDMESSLCYNDSSRVTLTEVANMRYALSRYGGMSPGVGYEIMNKGPDWHLLRVKGHPVYVPKRETTHKKPERPEYELPEYDFEECN